MLSQLEASAAELKLQNISIRVANVQDLSFAQDASFDAITCSLGVHLVQDMAK